ncbi:MAG: hypothetical protein Q4B36_06390 [Tissierellia bacterium]|nr:hypothetical protein [Tissierellia bacterium]
MKVVSEYLKANIGYEQLAKNTIYLIKVLFKHGSMPTILKAMMG